MHVQLFLDQLDSKILDIAVAQEKCELLVILLYMDIHPDKLQINVAFSRLFQSMFKVFSNNISKA